MKREIQRNDFIYKKRESIERKIDCKFTHTKVSFTFIFQKGERKKNWGKFKNVQINYLFNNDITYLYCLPILNVYPLDSMAQERIIAFSIS